MGTHIPSECPEVQPLPSVLESDRENFQVQLQVALNQLGALHSLEVGALQRENTWLKVQVGKLQKSVKTLQLVRSKPKPEIELPSGEAHDAAPAWVYRSRSGEEDGSVAEDPEPDHPRQLPQGKLQQAQPVVKVSAPETPPAKEAAPGSPASRQASEGARAVRILDEGGRTERGSILDESGKADRKSKLVLRADNAPKEVIEKMQEIEVSTGQFHTAAGKALLTAQKKGTRKKSLTAAHYGTGIKRHIGPIVESSAFDFLCGAVIMLNSILIGWNVEYKTHHLNQDMPFIETAGHICSGFFLVELCLRLYVQGKYYFHADNRPWNFFDITLVIFSIVDFITVLLFDETHGGGVASNLKTIKMFRILRVFRVFRFFRELSLLVIMIVDSIRSLVWALIMLTVLIYVFAICFTTSASNYIEEHGDAGDPGVTRWFGTLLRSVYALVLSMLGGVSWHEVSDPLFQMHWSQAPLFFFYITFTILAVLNIITGVFVDNAVETAQTQREFLVQKEMEIKEKYVKEMREFFTEMDQDGSGTVTLEEVKEYFDDLRVQSYFKALGIDPADTERLFHLIDDDGSGEISVDEFLDGCLRLKGSARSIDVHALMYECKRLEQRQDIMLRALGAEPMARSPKGSKPKNVFFGQAKVDHRNGLSEEDLSCPFEPDELDRDIGRYGMSGGQAECRIATANAAGAGCADARVIPVVSEIGILLDEDDQPGDLDRQAVPMSEIDILLKLEDQHGDPDRQAVTTISTSSLAGQGTDHSNSPPDSSGARSSAGREAYKEDSMDEEEYLSW